jgi:hypothetical protein
MILCGATLIAAASPAAIMPPQAANSQAPHFSRIA